MLKITIQGITTTFCRFERGFHLYSKQQKSNANVKANVKKSTVDNQA